jgi:transposase
MMAVMPQMRVMVAVEPVDMRKGIDGLVAVCRQRLQADPMGGTLFVFRSRRGHTLKILVYDGQGFWLCQKRLSAGRFGWWPVEGATTTHPLDAHQLQVLLWNGDPTQARIGPMWKPLSGGSDPVK